MLLTKANIYNYTEYLTRTVPSLAHFHSEAKQNKSHKTDQSWLAKAQLIFEQFSDLIPVPTSQEQYLDHLSQLMLELKEEILKLQAELVDFRPGKPYYATDIHGQSCELIIPNLDDHGARSKYLLNILNYSEIASALENGSKQVLPYNLAVAAEYTHTKWQACASLDSIWAHWKDMWMKGTSNSNLGSWKLIPPSDNLEHTYTAFGWQPWNTMSHDERQRVQASEAEISSSWKILSTKLESLVKKYANQLKNVDQVICFALGPTSHHHPASFVQHLAAHTIRDALHTLKTPDGKSSPMPILAQDPAYCERCRVVLKEELDVTTTTNLDGFLQLTKNTFVICTAPSAPVLQIIADLLWDVGGPAAILCDTVDEDYLSPLRPGYVHVADESTRNLVEYTRNCEVEYFGDAREVLGMSWDEFTKKYPLGPAQLKRKHETEKRAWTRADTEGLERCTELYRLSAKVNFRDVMLYVRK